MTSCVFSVETRATFLTCTAVLAPSNWSGNSIGAGSKCDWEGNMWRSITRGGRGGGKRTEGGASPTQTRLSFSLALLHPPRKCPEGDSCVIKDTAKINVIISGNGIDGGNFDIQRRYLWRFWCLARTKLVSGTTLISMYQCAAYFAHKIRAPRVW